jgi:hypothetical protein
LIQKSLAPSGKGCTFFYPARSFALATHEVRADPTLLPPISSSLTKPLARPAGPHPLAFDHSLCLNCNGFQFPVAGSGILH